MITNSPFVQLFMVILAGAILVLYIRPSIAEIRTTQDQIEVYNYELARVTDVNKLVAEHASTINTLPLSSLQALEKYIPIQIDEIAIMRDLQLVVESVGATLVMLEYASGDAAQDDNVDIETAATNDKPKATKFRLGVNTSYDNLKQLLSTIELNNYQLTIDSADVTPNDDGQLNVDITLIAYSLESATTE